ncbi:related to Mitochondrial distribution and morphology protein 10 [Ustilago trichophora]|uniref:Mitochondrial distribution and morphology protein 10 n=1 Tax=Ustilago trichophora TaxID=86804 RepID=A0A5C3DT23_9BASI|nr:related to Mitochondrial distribution and morphology protein 10 [Ustilago trichophora]
MHDFVSHILRQYFHATAWNEYNSYLHLTSSSAAILDFPVPTGLSLSISASPTPPFFTTYRLGALPNLRAGVGYIYASTHNPIDFGKSSKDVKLKEIIERFRIVEAPRRPNSVTKRAEEEYYWLAGERFSEPVAGIVDSKAGQGEGGEYLVYGCMHVPSARLDALWTKRISPTWQLIVTAVSTPPKYPLNALHSAALATQSAYSGATAAGGKGAGLAGSADRLDSSTHTLSSSSANLSSSTSTQQSTASTAPASYGLGPPGSTNLQLTLQRDTGRWFTEYSYSVDDALWGFRVLHNFGTPADSAPSHSSDSAIATLTADSNSTSTTLAGATKPRIDSTRSALGSSTVEDTDAGGGLRGRFSAGAEVFISTVEKSAGLSTGIRFSTLPDTPQHNPIITPLFDATHSPGPQTEFTQPQNNGPSQPPTVITATLNPMMGHLSTAYAARMARDVVVCSRFDFNVYSYESEWTVGAEYWLRSAGHSHSHPLAAPSPSAPAIGSVHKEKEAVRPVAAAQTLSLRDSPNLLTNSTTSETNANANVDASSYSLRPVDPSPSSLPSTAALPSDPNAPPASTLPSTLQTLLSPITGVLKARISTTSDIRLLWQGRLSNCLLSLGVKADLSPSSPTASSLSSQSNVAKMGIVKSIGLEVMYFSAAEEVD